MIHAFAGGEHEPAQGGLGYGGGIMTPGIARNATFAASITVDCHSQCQNMGDLSSKGKLWTYIKNELRPFGNQLLHELPPESLNNDFICPQILEFPQMSLREEEQE